MKAAFGTSLAISRSCEDPALSASPLGSAAYAQRVLREEAQADGKRRLVIGLTVMAAAIALTTLLLYPLREVAPAVSLGVVYLLGVLLIASRWGPWLGVLSALASAAAFNFFHIPSTGQFTVADAENWAALAVFFLAAVFATELAQRVRQRAEEADQRRREADLAAEMARLLLRGNDLSESLAIVGERVARAIDLKPVSIVPTSQEAAPGEIVFPLREGSRQLGTLVVPAAADERTQRRLEERIIPALEALLAAAVEREELLGDRVEAVALRRTDSLKTALLRAVSHDLRSPLTAIRAAAEPLRDGNLDRSARFELASVVMEESERLSRLIDNLLDLSRLEAGAAEPRAAPCDIAEVLQAAVDELRVPKSAIRLQISDNIPEMHVDPAQLQRAFANLIENAYDHGRGHPVMLRASALHNRVMIRVVDRGPGIPSAERERVFEPFFRREAEPGGRRGSGLGLAIVRGFVEGNGGRVTVESLPGQGTSFVLEFPIDQSRLPAASGNNDPGTIRA
jgi:two-component system, OmpR family, sensor histidine kinase KdpD